MSEGDSEEKVEKDFATHRQMTIVEAVRRLLALGHSEQDAQRIVFEWIDKLEQNGITD